MVSSSIWFRYAANKLEYSVSITSKAYRQGQITKTEYGDSIWKNLLQGRLTYLPWIKGGEEMKPIITEQGATLKPYSSSDSSEGFLFSPLLISFLKPSVPAGREKSKSLSEGNYKMFLSRVFRRTLFAAAKSESSTAAASTFSSGHNPLEAFFEVDRTAEDDKPVVYGRSWKASELRLKSWDDLRKLWFVLYKEKNMLMTQCQMLHSQNLRFPNPERIPKVRKSMCRIKHVLTERAIEEPDARRSVETKRLINAM